MVLMYCLSADCMKGKQLMKSLDGLQLEETSESQDFLSFLTVPGLISGSSCVHLNIICQDMATMCRTSLCFLEKDYVQSASHLHKISTVEWKLWCSYIAAFASYLTGEDLSEVTQKLRHMLTVNDTMLNACLKARIYNLMGCVLAKQNEPYLAVDQFEQAISSDESLLTPLYNVACQYRKLELQDAELETLDLLCMHLKSRTSSTSCLYEQKNLMLHPVLRIADILDDTLAYFPVCLMVARRCLSLCRYDNAAEKYLVLMTAMTKTPVLVNSDFNSSVQSVQDVFHEAAFSLLKCYRYRDALDVCHQAISAQVQFTPSGESRDIEVACTGTFKETGLSRQTVPVHSTREDQTYPMVLHSDKPDGFNIESRKRQKSEHTYEDNSDAMGSKIADADYFSEDVLAWTIKAHAHLGLNDQDASLMAANRILTCLSGVHTVVSPDPLVPSEPLAKRPKWESENQMESGEHRIKINLLQLKAHIHNLKAVIQSQNNCLEDALHNLRLGLQLASDDTSIRYNYTLLMVKMHRKDEGLRNWLQFRQKSHQLGISNPFSTGAAEDDFLKLDSLAKLHTKS